MVEFLVEDGKAGESWAKAWEESSVNALAMMKIVEGFIMTLGNIACKDAGVAGQSSSCEQGKRHMGCEIGLVC